MTKTTQERIDDVIQRWSSGLRLSADQKARLRTVVTARENELQKVRVKLKEIRKKHLPKMKALLSDQQVEQLKQLRKQWKAASAK